MTDKTCKQCNNQFNFNNDKSNPLLITNRRSFCSSECYKIYRKSDECRKQYMISYLKNRNINIEYDLITFEELTIEFHKIRSSDIKKTQTKRVNTIYEKYGDEGFVTMCTKGKNNYRIKFLIDNDIIEKNNDLSNDEIDELFLKHFNEISGHGNKIRDGRLEIYGNAEDNFIAYSESAKKSKDIQTINYFNLPSDIPKEEFEIFRKKYCKIINQRSKEQIIEWKRAHINKYWRKDLSSEDIKNLQITEIDRLYSEYMSDRTSGLSESIKSGWKCTKKGFYTFRNNKTIFYRSSWELEFFKKINDYKPFTNFILPKSYKYNYDGYEKRYFPDCQFDWNGKTYIIEIKPLQKVKENFKKFENILLDETIEFRIVTQYDIFLDDETFIKNLKKILKNKVNKDEYTDDKVLGI